MTALQEIDSLRESEERLRLFIEHAPAGIVMLDRNMRYLAVSRRWLKNYDINENIIGRSHYEVLPEIPGAWRDMHQRCLAGAVERLDCVPFRRADGSVQWIRCEIRPWQDGRGDIGGILISSEDITDAQNAEQAMRQSEDRYRMLFEHAVDGIVLSNAAGRFTDVNSAGHNMLGYTRDEFLSCTFVDVLAPEELIRLAPAVAKLAEGEVTSSEWRLRRKDGSEIVAETVGRQLPDGRLLSILRDITGRKRAEEAMRQSEQRLKLLAEASSNVVYRMSPDWGEMRQLMGGGFLADTASPSRAWLMEYVPTDEQERVNAAIDEAIQSRSIFELEHRVIQADGGVGWTFSRAVPLLDRDGDIIEWIGSASDVTGRKQEELTLRESEAALRLSQMRLRHAADAARLTYAEFDFKNGRLHLAENFAQVMGYAPPPIPAATDLAKITADLLSHIGPEDRARVQAANRGFLEGKLDGSVTYRVIGDDGMVRWIEGKWNTVADADGRPAQAMATCLDVTAQFEARIALAAAKEKADEILASIGDGFYVLDAQWRFTYFNASAEKLLGKQRDDVIGRLFSDVFPMCKDSLVHANYRWVMKAKQPLEFEYVSDILKRWTAYSVYPTSEDGVSVYIRDISNHKAVEGELVAAKAEAERANQAKSKFLAAASHDLRQPVQSLVLLLSVMERQVAGQSKTVETAKMMRAAVDGLHGLLTSVLDISRLDAGVVAPIAEFVDLGALVSRLAVEYAPKAANRALELRRVARGLHVRTDSALLERALRNLIENALRYTPKGGILLGVRRRGQFVRLDVVDTGIGISADKRAAIFEEFHQLNNPGRDLEQGLGLGLAIVRRLANLLGAPVEVASKVGRGSRFSLTLPIVHVAAPIVADRAAIDDVGGRILIVEDNAIVRNGLEALLRQCGYETLAVAFGEDALELAAQEAWRFDLIVTDYRLGSGLTGIEMAKEIHNRAGRSIPTLVLTGDTAGGRIAEIETCGFAILHKPVDAEDLRREIARLLGA